MTRSFSFSRAWDANRRQIERQGGPDRDGIERLPETARELRNPDTGEVVKTRLSKRDSAIGIESETFHHSGEEVVVIAEHPVIKGGRPTGDIEVEYMALGTDDRPRTYRQLWEKTGEGSHTAHKPQRIFE